MIKCASSISVFGSISLDEFTLSNFEADWSKTLIALITRIISRANYPKLVKMELFNPPPP